MPFNQPVERIHPHGGEYHIQLQSPRNWRLRRNRYQERNKALPRAVESWVSAGSTRCPASVRSTGGTGDGTAALCCPQQPSSFVSEPRQKAHWAALHKTRTYRQTDRKKDAKNGWTFMRCLSCHTDTEIPLYHFCLFSIFETLQWNISGADDKTYNWCRRCKILILFILLFFFIKPSTTRDCLSGHIKT